MKRYYFFSILLVLLSLPGHVQGIQSKKEKLYEIMIAYHLSFYKKNISINEKNEEAKNRLIELDR